MNENKIGADSIGNFTLVDVGLDWPCIVGGEWNRTHLLSTKRSLHIYRAALKM